MGLSLRLSTTTYACTRLVLSLWRGHMRETRRLVRLLLVTFALGLGWCQVYAQPDNPDRAAAVVGEPVHPHQRWQPGSPSQTWDYPYRPERWRSPQGAAPPQNPYPPGGWSSPRPPYPEAGYPPSQWYTPPPQYKRENPYPPGYWQPPSRPYGWEPYQPGQWESPPPNPTWSPR
jgi:hypothetical protein